MLTQRYAGQIEAPYCGRAYGCCLDVLAEPDQIRMAKDIALPSFQLALQNLDRMRTVVCRDWLSAANGMARRCCRNKSNEPFSKKPGRRGAEFTRGHWDPDCPEGDQNKHTQETEVLEFRVVEKFDPKLFERP